MVHSRKSINLYAFSCGVFGIVFLTKIASYLTPYKLYFSFSAFLYSQENFLRWEALAIKLLIPALVGFLLFYFPFVWLILTRGSAVSYRMIYRYLAQQSETTARTAGFFAALLMAWPFIAYWDILMEASLQHLQFSFLCVYFLYFISYSYFAGLGVNLASLVSYKQLPQQATDGVSTRLAWLETVRTSLLGIITSAIATYFASRLGGAP